MREGKCSPGTCWARQSTKHEKALDKFAIGKVRETCQRPAHPMPGKIFYLCANIQHCNVWPGASKSLSVLPSFSCSNEPFKTDLPCFHNWKWLHWRNTRYAAAYTILLGRILVFAQEDPPTTNTPPFSLKVCQDVYPHERFAKANYIRERPQERRHSYP